MSNQYIGFGLVIVVVIGLLIWRRDRKLWLFGALALCTLVLSLGAGKNVYLPWNTVVYEPILQNIRPDRFLTETYLALAVLLCLIVDHVNESVRARSGSRVAASDSRNYPTALAVAAGLGVGALALLPIAAYMAQGLPLTTRAVKIPTYFQHPPATVRGRDVLYVFPAANSGIETAMTWQAVDGMRYAMVGLGGPSGVLSRMPYDVRQGSAVLSNVAYPFPGPVPITSGAIESVRRSLAAWGVTTVIVPNDPDLPPYDQVASTTLANALITAATGQAPTYRSKAWVWNHVRTLTTELIPTTAQFASCTKGLPSKGTTASRLTISCLLEAR